jgi:hypothetical protein
MVPKFYDKKHDHLPADIVSLDLHKQPDRGIAKLYARLLTDTDLQERLESRIDEIEEELENENTVSF